MSEKNEVSLERLFKEFESAVELIEEMTLIPDNFELELIRKLPTDLEALAYRVYLRADDLDEDEFFARVDIWTAGERWGFHGEGFAVDFHEAFESSSAESTITSEELDSILGGSVYAVDKAKLETLAEDSPRILFLVKGLMALCNGIYLASFTTAPRELPLALSEAEETRFDAQSTKDVERTLTLAEAKELYSDDEEFVMLLDWKMSKP